MKYGLDFFKEVYYDFKILKSEKNLIIIVIINKMKNIKYYLK